MQKDGAVRVGEAAHQQLLELEAAAEEEAEVGRVCRGREAPRASGVGSWTPGGPMCSRGPQCSIARKRGGFDAAGGRSQAKLAERERVGERE